MATRTAFRTFKDQLEASELSPRALQRFLELDPDSPVTRVRFKPNVFSDQPPPAYDVNQHLYEWQQTRARAARQALRGAKARRPTVVAEGDSWFNLPPIIRPKAIADRIASNGTYNVINIAHWGDTLKQILQRKQYLPSLAEHNTEWFAVSAGGNDIQDALAARRLLVPYDPGSPAGPWVSTTGLQVLDDIGQDFRSLLAEVTHQFPNQKILSYAYDYPQPQTGKGKYIGQHLKALNYPPDLWSKLMHDLMSRVATKIRDAGVGLATVAFLDCFGMAQSLPWFDDMHPDTAGFKALARAFEVRMAATATRETLRKRVRQGARVKPRRSTQARRAKSTRKR